MIKFRFTPKITALTATFAGVYALLRIIPTFPMLGVSGGAFTLADILPPLYGIILGPYLASSAILVGTLLSFVLGRPILFLGLDFLPGMVNAAIVGLLLNRSRKTAIILYVIPLALFLVHPYTVNFIHVKVFGFRFILFFAWMHLIALLLLISPISSEAVKWINRSKNMKTPLGVALISFIGTMGQHLMGNILYESIIGIIQSTSISAFKAVWYTVFWLYPLERLTLVAVTTVVGTPMLKLAKNYLDAHLQNWAFKQKNNLLKTSR